MKKWLVALVLCLALCLAACAAMADPSISIQEQQDIVFDNESGIVKMPTFTWFSVRLSGVNGTPDLIRIHYNEDWTEELPYVPEDWTNGYGVRLDDAGDFDLYVEVQVGGNWIPSNHIAITLESDGDAIAPKFAGKVENVAYDPGKTFTVSGIEDAEDNYTYFAEIYRLDSRGRIDSDSFVSGVDWDEDRQFVFTMGEGEEEVAPGSYAMIFGSFSAGKNATRNFHKPYYFTVYTPVPQISVAGPDENGTIPTFSDITVFINATGAQGVRVYSGDWEGYDDITGWKEWKNGEWGNNHEDIVYSFRYYQSCEENEGYNSYGIHAEATYDGKNWIDSNTVEVTCTSQGQAGEPDVNVVPETVTVGEDIVLSGISLPEESQDGLICFADVYGWDEENNGPDWNRYFTARDWNEEEKTIRIETGSGEDRVPVGKCAVLVRCAGEGLEIGQQVYPVEVVWPKGMLDDIEYRTDISYAEASSTGFDITIPNHEGVDHYAVVFYGSDDEYEGKEAYVQTLQEDSGKRTVRMQPFGDEPLNGVPNEPGTFKLHIHAYPRAYSDDENHDDEAAYREDTIQIAENNGRLTIGVENAEIDEGAVSGCYYYKLIPDTDVDVFEMGWGSDPEATAPDQFYKTGIRDWHQDSNDQPFIIALPPEDENSDVLFYRLIGVEDWTRIILNYDKGKIDDGIAATITGAEEGPELLTPYTVSWSDKGADAYIFHWKMPKNEEYSFIVTENAIDLSEDRFGGVENTLAYVGDYEYWVETLKDDYCGASDHEQFTVSIPEEDNRIILSSDLQDEITGEITIKLNETVDFKIHVDNMEENPPDECQMMVGEWMENIGLDWEGNSEYPWTAGSEVPDGEYTYTAYVRARYGEDWVYSSTVPVTVTQNAREIEGPLTWTPVGKPTTEAGETYYEVPLDGRFLINVDNPDEDQEEVAFYGMYIEENGEWIADSHWVKADRTAATTSVPMTVSRCEAGKKYDVHVYAVKYGAKNYDALETIRILVTGPENPENQQGDEDNPFIVSMKKTFATGEPLRISVRYTNPDYIEGWMHIRIHNKENPEEVLYEDGGGFDDFWDDGAASQTSGTFVMDAEIWKNGQDSPYQTYEKIWEFDVTAPDGQVAEIQIDEPVSLLNEGENLTFTLQTTADPVNNTVAAEFYSVVLKRVDQGYRDVAWRDEIEANEGISQPITFKGDEEYFEAGGQYEASIMGYRAGCEASFASFRFVVARNVDETLLLKVDGTDEPAERAILSLQNVRVKVEADNNPTAVRVLSGDEWDFWRQGDNFIRDWSFGDGDVILYAEATWDPIDFDELNANDWKIDDNGEIRNFDWDRDVVWRARSNTILLHIENPYGAMKMPEVTLANNSVAWGDCLIVNIEDEAITDTDGNPVPDGRYFCNIDELQGEGDEARWERRINNVRPALHSGANYIPTSTLNENGVYQIEIGADAEGYQVVSECLEFRVRRDPAPGTVVQDFTVNGSNRDQITAQVCEELELVAYRFGAEWCEVDISKEGEPGWHVLKNNNENNMLSDFWFANEAGVYYLTAYANGHLTDENGNGIVDEHGNDMWREEIRTVTVEVNLPENELGELNVTMGDKAYLGDQLEVVFGEVENAENFQYWIHSTGDEENLMNDNRNDAGSLFIDTTELPGPGVYQVELDAMAVGYTQSHAVLHFALLDREAKEYSDDQNGAYFTLNSQNLTDDEGNLSVPTSEDIEIIAYERGMSKAELLFTKIIEVNGNPQETEESPYETIDSQDGPGLRTIFSRGDSGEYRLYFRGQSIETGQWGDPRFICALTVDAANGNLVAPTIRINGDDGEQEDLVVIAAEQSDTLTIEISGVENAENYHVRLTEFGDGRAIYENDHTPPENEDSILIPVQDGRIVPGRRYEVTCDVSATGYECSFAERSFLLQEDGLENSVILTVEEKEYWTGEEVEITVSADGATAFHIFANSEDRFYRADENGEIRDRFMLWDRDTLFYAYATTDPVAEGNEVNWNELALNWSMASDPARIMAESMGDTVVPSLEVPQEVTRGEWLEITVNEDGDARQIDLYIRSQDGQMTEFRRLWSPGTYKLPTTSLNAGEEYSVSINCIQARHIWTEGERYIVRVIAPEEDQAFFRVDKEELYPGEPFIPTVYAPDAAHIWIAFSGWDRNPGNMEGVWGDWEGDSGTNDANWEWYFDQPGEYSLTAWRQDTDGGELTEIDTVAMTVLEPEDLDVPEIQVESAVDVTGPVYVDIPLVENGYTYLLRVYQPDMENKPVYQYSKTAEEAKAQGGDENGTKILTFTLNTADVGLLEANQSYWIDCMVRPADRDYRHRGSIASRNIMTTNGETDGNIILSLEEEDNGNNVTVDENDGISVQINTEFRVRITVAENGDVPTAVAVYMGVHVERHPFNPDGDPFTVSLYEGQSGEKVIFARAYYGPIDENTNLDNVDWGNASNMLTVNIASGGITGIPYVDMERFPYATMAGNELVIYVTPGENAQEAHANLDRNPEGDWEDHVFTEWFNIEPVEGDAFAGKIIIPTEGLDCGTYRLYIDNSAPGYENNRFTEYVHIVDDPYQSGSKLVLPSKLKVIGEEAFAETIADTVIIPNGVTTIGRRAFADSKVRLVVIPGSVTNVAPDAFDGSMLWVVYGNSEAAFGVAEANNVIYYYTGE